MLRLELAATRALVVGQAYWCVEKIFLRQQNVTAIEKLLARLKVLTKQVHFFKCVLQTEFWFCFLPFSVQVFKNEFLKFVPRCVTFLPNFDIQQNIIYAFFV